MKLKQVVAAVAVAAAASASMPAMALVTFQGVTFGTSFAAVTPGERYLVTLTIDATGPLSGDWAPAMYFDMAAIKVGDVTIAALSAQSGGTFIGGYGNLGVGSPCADVEPTNGFVCANSSSNAGKGELLPGSYSFTWDIAGTNFDGLTAPHVQVFFRAEDGKKVGDLYSMSVPVPEPESYAMMLAGLATVGFMVRRRKRV